jgi:hypothetical protein
MLVGKGPATRPDHGDGAHSQVLISQGLDALMDVSYPTRCRSTLFTTIPSPVKNRKNTGAQSSRRRSKRLGRRLTASCVTAHHVSTWAIGDGKELC